MDLSEEHALKLGNQVADVNHPYITNLIDSPAKDVVSILDCIFVEDDAHDVRDTEKLQVKRKRGAKSSKPSHKKSASKESILESGAGSAEGDGQGDGELSPSPSHSPNLDRSKVLCEHIMPNKSYCILETVSIFSSFFILFGCSLACPSLPLYFLHPHPSSLLSPLSSLLFPSLLSLHSFPFY